MFETVVRIVSRRGDASVGGDDRAIAIETPDGVVIALADGAGGTSNGARAAQAVIDRVAETPDARAWSDILAELDRDPARLGGGQATAVVLTVTRDAIVGASVGDSGAWIVRGETIDELTAEQVRKPLLGSGCSPWAIARSPLGVGTLLVASDGLLGYAKRADIARVVGGANLATAVDELVELVRLRSGALPDDVSIVLCRAR